jgi:hypothetical protein
MRDVAAAQKFNSLDEDPLSARRTFTGEIAEVSFKHRAALQIRMFDAPSRPAPA